MKKKYAVVWCGLGVAALGLTGTALGQEFFLPERETGFYVKVDVGPAWTEDVKVKEFLSVPNIGDLKFDTGVRFDFGGGYQFNRWIAAELETGVINNSIRNGGDSTYSSVPMMVNAVFTAPISSRFVPFAGIGGGGAVGVLDAERLGSPSLGFVGGRSLGPVRAERHVVFRRPAAPVRLRR